MALISLLIQLSQKYNLIYGLAITFSMVYSIRRKLNINPILPNLGLFLLMQNLYFTLRKDIYFQGTVNASDFEYSLNRLLDEKSLLRRLGFTKRKKLQSGNDIFEIKLIKPFPAFLGLMTMKYASVVPKLYLWSE
jgi:peptide/nickel transport system substrate-binding protein